MYYLLHIHNYMTFLYDDLKQCLQFSTSEGSQPWVGCARMKKYGEQSGLSHIVSFHRIFFHKNIYSKLMILKHKRKKELQLSEWLHICAIKNLFSHVLLMVRIIIQSWNFSKIYKYSFSFWKPSVTFLSLVPHSS